MNKNNPNFYEIRYHLKKFNRTMTLKYKDWCTAASQRKGKRCMLVKILILRYREENRYNNPSKRF